MTAVYDAILVSHDRKALKFKSDLSHSEEPKRHVLGCLTYHETENSEGLIILNLKF